MKSVAAWALFSLAISIPAASLGAVSFHAANAEYARNESRMLDARIRETEVLRHSLDDSSSRGQRVLAQVPQDVSEADLVTVLRDSAPVEPYGVPFYSIRENVVVVAKDPKENVDSVRRALASDALLMKLHSGNIPAYATTSFSFTSSEESQLMVRRLSNETLVGWFRNADTILRGADQTLASDYKLERTAETANKFFFAEADIDILRKSKNPTMRVISDTPIRVSALKEQESLASLTVAHNLHFHIAIRYPDQVAAWLKQQYRQQVAAGLLSITLLVAVAAAFFKRARNAQRLADLRTDFVAAVSHELRTPLASVRMFAELLEAGDVPEDERAEVEVFLAGETRRLHATLDRMLRFGALARGKLVLDKKTQLLAPIIQEAASKRTVAIEVDPDLDANVDGGLLTLAIDNLLSNAVKYAPVEDGDAPHIVRARTEGKDVVIDVIDHGPGLPKNAQKKIFLPFERADNRLSRATEGSGVGLALVRGIARAHGGEVSLVSQLGQGATFTLRLPRT